MPVAAVVATVGADATATDPGGKNEISAKFLLFSVLVMVPVKAPSQAPFPVPVRVITGSSSTPNGNVLL